MSNKYYQSAKNFFGFIEEKSVPPVSAITEATRDGLYKAYIPKFLYKPPFGYPRYVDIVTIRRLAAMPFVEMCISTIIDEICSIPWDIVPKQDKEINDTLQKQIDEVKNFFHNPNTNKESFEKIRRKYLRDLLEIDAGVINKVFNMKEQMVEILARDGATFTKNPDIYGMIVDREDLILDQAILPPNKEASAMAVDPGMISAADAREKAAYFQYGWISGARPIPFGKKEIVWFERNPRTDSIYGRCVDSQTVIETNQGKIPIIEIVDEKKDVLIKSYNIKYKKYEYKKILNYYSREYSKPLLNLKIGDGKRAYSLHCTAEHPILTKKGYVEAKNLKLMDNILVIGKTLTDKQKEFLYGTLLGDSSLYCKRNRGYPSFRTGHSKEQKDYIEWMENSLYNLGLTKFEYIQSSPHYPDRKNTMIRLSGKVDPVLDQLRRITYPDYKKKVTQEWTDKLTPLGIAAWIMDDGSIGKSGLILCTDSFSNEECELLIYKLKEFGLKTTINKSTEGNNRLYISKDSMEKLKELVKDYIKLDGKKQWIAKPLNVVNIEDAVEVPITNIGLTNSRKKVYDLEIEDNHNLITNKMIIHNSPVQNLAETIQTLIYSIEHNLEYFNDNSIPKGLLGLEGADSDEIEAFKDQWLEQQRDKDAAGNWKKKFHQLPIVGKIPTFVKFQLTNAELELLEGQKWWAKMVWACFGVTSVELGYTEDSKGLANQIVQSNVFKKRSINPILRLEEFQINQEIISEFEYEDLEFKFLLFDVEEETKKAQLYQLQLNAGYKSINEIRKDEGLEEVEWGEKQSAEEMMEMQNKFSPGNTAGGAMKREEADQIKKVKKEKENLTSQKSIELNPLILKPNEVMDEDRLRRSIIYVLKMNEKKIKSLIEKEMGISKLQEIKAIDDLAKVIKNILNFEGLKAVSDAIIQSTFIDGWDNAEKQVNQNLMMNKDAINFIQGYTFNNIKGMTEEIVNDLRQEIERGIMAGEGVAKIKSRVGKVFDAGENRAAMIARTETNRAENQGKLQGFKASGKIYKKKWNTHFDDRTSEICKGLHDKIVDMDENFKDAKTGWEGPVPPSHVNCRSSVLYIVEDAELKAKEEEKKLKVKEKAEAEIIDQKIDVALKEKEVEIKNRKESLLKRLEDDLDEGDKNLSG